MWGRRKYGWNKRDSLTSSTAPRLMAFYTFSTRRFVDALVPKSNQTPATTLRTRGRGRSGT